jgi:hypothetical protein
MSSQDKVKLRTQLDALTYAQKLWEAIDTPVSLGCYLRTKHSEFRQLVEMSIRPSDYVDPSSFFSDYQSVKILSKYPFLNTGIDTRQVAKGKFDEAELACRLTNERFRNRSNGSFFANHVESIISSAQYKISSILGVVPKLENMQFSFGPGATYGVRKETSVYNKVSSDLECTYAFVGKLGDFLAEFPGWIPEGTHSVSLIPGSQLAFVPKDAKTDRPICIEPLLNGLYQKGFGSYLRNRLRKFGVDLDDQGINQKLVSRAHLDRLSTVDFASASDTIAYHLVLDLLPIDWFEALDIARSPRYIYEGVWTPFEKFSSMGNAYTFELETLIFYSLATSVCEHLGIKYETGVNLSVYGDDVIIPQDAFDLFQEVAEICGFTINLKKSFRQGPFFESCGHDFFLGTFVRPFLFKKRINSLLPSFYATNTILRINRRLSKMGAKSPLSSKPSTPSVQSRLHGLYGWCVSRIPKRLLAFGPEGYGDGHLIADFDISTPTRHSCFDGWWFHSYVESPILISKEEWPTAYALYFTRDQGWSNLFDPSNKRELEPTDNSSGYAVRGRTRTKRIRVLCHGEWQGPFDYLYPSDGVDLSFLKSLPACKKKRLRRSTMKKEAHAV